MHGKWIDWLNESLFLMVSMLVSNIILFKLECYYGVFSPLGRVAWMMPWALTYPWTKQIVWRWFNVE